MRVPRFVGDRRIEHREVDVPEPGPGQLLLRVKANALCGSDRRQYLEGSSVTPGHEAAGVVAAVGATTKTPVGTPGVVYLMDFCGGCRNCRLGFTNQCLAKRGDLGFNRDGGLGPYALVSETAFFPIDDGLPLAEATMLLDVMGTSRHALERARLLRRDVESVIIAGAGPVGLGILAITRLLLSDVPVLISDVGGYRLLLAERLGGVPVRLPTETFKDVLGSRGLSGADVAFDGSGKTAARMACLEALGTRGVLVCVGHGEGLDLDVSRDLIRPEGAVLGSQYFRYDELAENLRLLRAHRPYLGQIITHRYPTSELGAAFQAFFSGNSGKVIVEQ